MNKLKFEHQLIGAVIISLPIWLIFFDNAILKIIALFWGGYGWFITVSFVVLKEGDTWKLNLRGKKIEVKKRKT